MNVSAAGSDIKHKALIMYTRSPRSGRDKFLITGCQRSGTTLMAMILEAHPYVEIIEETDKRFHLEGKITRELNLLRIADHSIRGGHMIGYKAPRDSHRIGEISEVFFGMRVLWLERDVRQSVASMLALQIGCSSWAALFAPKEISKYLDQTPHGAAGKAFLWAKNIEDTRAQSVAYGAICWLVKREQRRLAGRLIGSDVMKIDYDNLVRAPRDVLERILNFLGLGWDQAVLAHSRAISRTMRPGKSDPGRPIDASSVGIWRRELTPNDLALIAEAQRWFDSETD